MKIFQIVFCALLVFASGCDVREREAALQAKETALNQKEQELLLKEKTLQLKEEALNQMKQKLDSTLLVDTTAQFNQNLIGLWSVKMVCTQTSCPGSAVGDTKTENWDISYEGRYVIARVSVNNELVGAYSGIFNGTTLELEQNTETAANQPTTKILVRLKLLNPKQMEGIREIERIGECKITYTVTMDKK